MSDNMTDDAVARRSTHLEPVHAEVVPPVARAREPLPDTTEPGEHGVVAPKRRFGKTAIALVAASVVAFAGWAALGVAVAQLGQVSQDLAAVESERDRFESRATNLETSLDRTEAERDELAAGVAAVEEREKAVEDGDWTKVG